MLLSTKILCKAVDDIAVCCFRKVTYSALTYLILDALRDYQLIVLIYYSFAFLVISFSFSTINPLHIKNMHLATTNNYYHKTFKTSLSQKISSHKISRK